MKTRNLMAICALCAPLCAATAAPTVPAVQSTPCAPAVQTAGSCAPAPQSAGQCAYTPDILASPRLRGVMSPGRDMTEDDFRTLADWGATLLRFQMVRDWHGVGGNRDLDEYDPAYANHFVETWRRIARRFAPAVQTSGIYGYDLYNEPVQKREAAPGCGWDWTYHAFREWEGWSVEHEPVAFGTTPDCFAPSADNPRKRALLDGLAK